MNQLHFEKTIATDRTAEPTYISLPLPQGLTKDSESVRLLDKETTLPRQTRCLTRWPDQSIKWLLVAFQPDLPGNQAKDFFYDFAGTTPPAPEESVKIEKLTDGWMVNTGPLEVKIDICSFALFSEARLNGQQIIGPEGTGRGFFYQDDNGCLNTMAEGRVESTEWIEQGPLRAKLVVKGMHSGDSPLRYRVAIEFYAGKPWLRIQYQAVAVGSAEYKTISHWGLKLKPTGRADRCEAAMGHYRCNPAPGAPLDAKSIETNGEQALYTSFEAIPETYCANFWADWNDSKRGGIGVSVFQAMQNFPKAAHTSPESLEIDLLPADQPPLTLRRGVGKTHSLQLHFHEPEEDLNEINRRSFLFQMPDLPRLETKIYTRADVLNERLPSRRFDAFDHWLHERALNVPRAFGMLHWGDYVDDNYTNQGRGQGKGVWANGEYDVPHVYYLLHLLLGERWLRDYAAVTARHWMDVDFCHDSEDPLQQGGLIIHSADHVSGNVDISHEWAAGLLDHWHMTGDEEALETAVSIGENILRHLATPRFQEGATLASCRTMGWALRALGPLWQETGDQRFRDECERIVDVFCRRLQKMGGILDTYTEHNLGRTPFMISLTIESLRQWGEIADDEGVIMPILAQAEDLLQNAVGTGGLMYYKELPFLHRYKPMLQTILPFIEAYRQTGKNKFLQPAYRVVEMIMRTATHARRHTGKSLVEDALLLTGYSWAAFDIQPMIAFYATTAEVKDNNGEPLLKALDYKNIEVPGQQ